MLCVFINGRENNFPDFSRMVPASLFFKDSGRRNVGLIFVKAQKQLMMAIMSFISRSL